MIKIIFFLFILGLKSQWHKNSKVPEITLKNLDDSIGKENIIFLKFYTPWCYFCRLMSEDYEKLYTMVEENQDKFDNLQIRRVNCVDSKQICHYYNVHGYPELVLFNKGSDKPVALYPQQERSIELMEEFLIENIEILRKQNQIEIMEKVEQIHEEVKEEVKNTTTTQAILNEDKLENAEFIKAQQEKNQQQEVLKKFNNLKIDQNLKLHQKVINHFNDIKMEYLDDMRYLYNQYKHLSDDNKLANQILNVFLGASLGVALRYYF